MDINQLLRSLGLQQAYQAYQQNIGEPFAAAVGGAGRGYLGFDKPEYGGLLGEEAYRMGQAMGNMPGLGAPAGAFKVGMQAAAKAPGLLADAVQMMKANPEAGLLAITGYHGSPHRFTKFDASKIGSGEGGQAYGHGLYFAESPDVAQGYRIGLSNSRPQLSQELENVLPDSFQGKAPDWADAIASGKTFSDLLATVKLPWQKALLRQNKQQIESFIKEAQKGGSFYTVDIPDEMVGKMLDWDKPLGQQPQLKAVLEKIGKELALPRMQDAEGAGFAYGMLANAVGGPKNASALLREHGIPGVSYLDQGSRGAGQGTRNFVVFPGEEEAVRILNVE